MVKFCRPEAEILFHCARTKLDPGRIQQLQALLRQNIDWPLLLDMAAYNHIQALTAQNLLRVGKDYIPSVIIDQLREHLQWNSQKNLLFTGELLNIVKTFQHQVDIMPLKGVILAEYIYGDVGLRDFSDLDVLIKEEALNESITLLEQLGYARQESLLSDDDALQQKHHTILVHRKRHVVVELHWQLADVEHGLMREGHNLWRHAQLTQLHQQPIWIPSNEDLLLYLCTHGYRHRWSRLSWITDVAEVLRAVKYLDWGYLVEEARGQRSLRKLVLGLRLAHDLADGDLPTDLLAHSPLEPKLNTTIDQLWKHIFVTQPPTPVQPSQIPSFHFETLAYHLKMSDHWRDRLRYGRHYVRRWLTPLSGDKAIIPLPRRLSFLYVVLRLFRLLLIYGGAVLGIIVNALTNRKSREGDME